MCGQTLRPEERVEVLGPPRFTLRTLLAVITGLCCLFGLMAALGSLWSIAILLIAGLVLAHVLGNSLGTKLRDRATRASALEAGPAGPRATAINACVQPGRLSQQIRLSRITLVMALGGAMAGAFLGAVGSAGAYPEAGTPAVALGTVSAAVLGAFAGFMTCSFVLVMRQAWREALAHGDAGRSRGAGQPRH
jgi:hypothetical protein